VWGGSAGIVALAKASESFGYELKKADPRTEALDT